MPQAIDLTDQFVRDFRLCEGELEELHVAHERLKAQRQAEKTEFDGEASRKLLAAQSEVDLLRRELTLAQEEVRKHSAPRPCTECERLRRDLDALQSQRPPSSPDDEAVRQSQSRLQAQVQSLERERKSQNLEVADLKKRLKEADDKCLGLERLIYKASQGS